MSGKGTDKFILQSPRGVSDCLERVANGLQDGSIKLQEARVYNRLAAQALRALTLRKKPVRSARPSERADARDEPDSDLDREPTFEQRLEQAAAERKRGERS